MTTDSVFFWGSYDNAIPGSSLAVPTKLSRIGTGSSSSLGFACTMINAENGWASFLNNNGTAVVPFGFGLNQWSNINQTGQNPIFPNPEQVGSTSGTGSFPWTNASSPPGPNGGIATLPFVQCDGGGEFGISLDSAGNVFSNGTDTHGQLGINNAVFPTTYALPQRVLGVGGTGHIALKVAYGAISGGSDHWIGLQSAGTVVACGSSQYGQTGDGLALGAGGIGGVDHTTLIQVVKGAQAGTTFLGDTTPISYVSVGDKQSMALESGGMHLFTWGRNDQGQLGIGTTGDPNNSSSPVDVTPFLVSAGATLPITLISGGGGVTNGDGHCLAIDSAGDLWAWGDNRDGQLGVGSSGNNFSTPQPVIESWGAATIVAASAGGDHSIALDSNGVLWAWGNNGNQQLTNTYGPGLHPTPVPITTLPGNLTISTTPGLSPFAGNQTSVVHGTQPPAPPVRFTKRRNLGGFFTPLFPPSGLGEDLPTKSRTLPTSGLSTGGALSPAYVSNTGDWLYDVWVRVATAYNGITPQFDIGTNIPTNTSGLFATQGMAPIPLWVADVTAGGNTGLVVPGAAPGPRASLSLSSGYETLGPTPSAPVGRTQVFISAGGALQAIISQDGTARTAVAATLTGNAIGSGGILTTPITAGTYTFVWTGTSLTLGGGGATPDPFTVTVASTITTLAGVVTVINAAVDAGSVVFSTLCVASTDGTHIILTDNGNGNIAHIGAGANGNTFGPGVSNDISALIGFSPPSVLTGGQGGDPGSLSGVAIVTFTPVTPSFT